MHEHNDNDTISSNRTRLTECSDDRKMSAPKESQNIIIVISLFSLSSINNQSRPHPNPRHALLTPSMPPSNSSVTNGDITITKSSAKELNPRSKPTEFLGPAGTTVVTFLTPLMAYLLFFGCNPTTGCPSLSLDTYKVGFQNGWPAINGKLWDWGAAGVYAGWYAFTVICWNILPGEQVEGTVLRNGKRKMYNLNGKYHTTQIRNIS